MIKKSTEIAQCSRCDCSFTTSAPRDGSIIRCPYCQQHFAFAPVSSRKNNSEAISGGAKTRVFIVDEKPRASDHSANFRSNQNPTWSRSYSPSRLMSGIRVDTIPLKYRIVSGRRGSNEEPCILCKSSLAPGILLNDNSYVCASCFEGLANITYPEKYEPQWRAYRREYEVWEQSRKAFTESLHRQVSDRLAQWTAARQEYANQGISSGASALLGPLMVISFIMIFVFPVIGVSGLVLSAFASAVSELGNQHRIKIWLDNNPMPESGEIVLSQKLQEWDLCHPKPRMPSLRHFNDPTAELSNRDRTIMHIFDHWPEYPPDWKLIAEYVKRRDGNRCQVSGCPSRVELHVHHKVPTSAGGAHVPSNLVCLCAFHHGLEPEQGHGRVWGDIKNRYFTLVRAHMRNNPGGKGQHAVNAHVRRLELVSTIELEQISKYHSFACPSCHNQRISYEVDEFASEVSAYCTDCAKGWVSKRALTEETGPRLAETLKVSRNHGSWKANWNMLSARTDSLFRSGSIKTHRYGSIRGNQHKSSTR
jgi:5-methylcytosine-specific restriction endonuclease McrA